MTQNTSETNINKPICNIDLDGWHLVGEVGEMNKEIVHEIY